MQAKARRYTIKEWLKPDKLRQIAAWSTKGMTQAEIAKTIGVADSTFKGWIGKYPEIKDAYREGAEQTDDKVEQALLRRALGYDHPVEKTMVELLPDGGRRQKVEKTTTHIPPDPTSMIFWLKNRRASEWRDRREMELAGLVGMVQIIDNIPDTNPD
jgi:transposase-like protein